MKAASNDERVWEALDLLGTDGVCGVGITPVWRSMEPNRPLYDTVTRVFQRAVAVGILDHPRRGEYRIIANLCAEDSRTPSVSPAPWSHRYVVYRAYAGDTLLYVGCTRKFEQRMRQHRTDRRSSVWAATVTRIVVRLFSDESSALGAERRAIATERPLLNLNRGYTRRLKAVPA